MPSEIKIMTSTVGLQTIEGNTNYGAGNTAKLVRVLQYLNWYCWTLKVKLTGFFFSVSGFHSSNANSALPDFTES